MKIENRQQFLIVLTAVLFALLIGNSMIYNPLARLWSARSAQIAGLSKQVKDGNNLIKRESVLRSRWSGMTANALPANTALAENQVLTALTAWSRASSAEVTSIMPQWKNDSTNYMTFNCRMEASGTLGSLSQFIYNIEKGPMALKLDSVELSAHNDTGQQLTLGLQISGLALLQPAAQVKR
jgi:Tfp pilus assembly protein PilO